MCVSLCVCDCLSTIRNKLCKFKTVYIDKFRLIGVSHVIIKLKNYLLTKYIILKNLNQRNI
jgi:hypothetical protein